MRVIKKNNSSKGDIIFDTINYIILGIASLLVLYPLYFVTIASISDPAAVNAGKVIFLPTKISVDGYIRIFQDMRIWTGYANTVLYTVVGTFIGVIITMMAAYALSRKSFSGKKFIMLFLITTMYFSGGLIPTYLVIKSLGLLNTRAVMIIFGSVTVFNIIIARTFIKSTIPDDLYEAAAIDGCNHFIFFFKMVMPLSKGLIAVLTLYYGIAQWNEFMKALIYLNNEKLYPLQLILRSILVQNQVSSQMAGDIENQLEQQKIAELIKYGVIIVSSLPVLVLYPFLQKYIVKGVMIGSLKD
ncbi:carbohydrate ABC transporter permease [Clostridium sp.]